MKFDIIIIGGGIIGSAAAYYLAKCGNAGRVVVIEPDPTYEFATTPQAAGGVRQMFSCPENIDMSRFSLDFYKNFTTKLSGSGAEIPDLGFHQQGYLFVVGEAGVEALMSNYERQSSMGVQVEILDRDALSDRFPSIQREDIVLACYSADDGWIDPNAALQGFKKSAMGFGVEYMNARVTAMSSGDHAIKSVALDSDETLESAFFINCAGPWANQIAGMSNAELPVQPMCRVQHFWTCEQPIEAMPLVKDEAGLFFRPEGDGFAGGCPSFDIEPGFVDNISYGFFADYFEDTVWPMIATLVPKFEAIKLKRSWSGHYAQNLLDGNMIIGQYSSGHENLITACGFSGHGIMHAPAVGRALAELALTNHFQTIDLSRMGIERVHNNTPYRESGIK